MHRKRGPVLSSRSPQSVNLKLLQTGGVLEAQMPAAGLPGGTRQKGNDAENMGTEYRGLTDEAARTDLFDIQRYIDGLSRFILTCQTPLTISIQGSWGTGKTSIMRLIQKSLDTRVPRRTLCIWFNTWQFSQFSMEENLSVSLLSCLLSELSSSDEDREAAARTARTLQSAGRFARELLLSAIDSRIGSRAADTLDRIMDGLSSEQTDAASVVQQLHRQFAECVERKLAATGMERIVVFIDDLDRLDPRRAVELLEVLKLFLDCENCVFVLAVDYSVVCLGVEAKYGGLLGNRADSAEKGRSFFDKIIQVPFKMPVAEYNLDNYVKNCFQQIGMSCTDEEVRTCVGLIRLSIGANPRSMKRLFNAYLLLTMVVSEEILRSDRNRMILFGILCLQQAFEKVYNFIVERRGVLTGEMLSALACADSQEDLDSVFPECTLDIRQVLQARSFLQMLLWDVLDADSSQSIDGREMEAFRSVLGASTMTSAADDPDSRGPVSSEVATLHELGADPLSEALARQLVEEVLDFSEDVTARYFSGRTKTVQLKRWGRTTFMTLCFRKYGLYVECSTRKMLYDAPAREIIKDICGKSRVQRVAFRLVRQGDGSLEPVSRARCLTVAKACWEKCPR